MAFESGLHLARYESSTTLDSEDSDRSSDSDSDVSDLLASSEESESEDEEASFQGDTSSEAEPEEPEEPEDTSPDVSAGQPVPEGDASDTAPSDSEPEPTEDPELDGAYWQRQGRKRRRTTTRTFVEEFEIAEEFTRLQEAAGVRKRRPVNPAVESMKARMLASLFGGSSDDDEPLLLGDL